MAIAAFFVRACGRWQQFAFPDRRAKTGSRTLEDWFPGMAIARFPRWASLGWVRALGKDSDSYSDTSRESFKMNIKAPTFASARMGLGRHEEGRIAKAIEQQTSQLPSDLFLWAATGSILGSLVLNAMGNKHQSLFVGQWAPTFLILGLYNKLVKLEGSD
jgi:hypothetical protein